jgi:hypothetical protein
VISPAIAVAAALAGATASPPVAVAVSPARLILVAPASRRLQLHNLGAATVVVDIPRVRSGLATIRPAHVVLRSGARATLTLRAKQRAGVGTGDREVVVLVLARPLRSARVGLRLRLGVRLRMRVRGRLVRRLDVTGVRVRRSHRMRTLLVFVVNRGNVVEQLRGRVAVTLLSRGRSVSRLRSRAARELLPGMRTVIALPYRGGAHGLVTAVVRCNRVSAYYRIRL